MEILEKKDRSEVIRRNNLIAKYASRKDLLSCITLYEAAIHEYGGANTHTYCAMINAYIRCGDMIGAENIFKALRERKFEPDVVSYTTLIKGYCQLMGNIERSIELYNEMIDVSNRKKKDILPNIRTVNTMLRGCVNTGRFMEAELIFNQLKDIHVTPDISSWEYMTLLYSQSLNLSKLLPLVGRLPSNTIKSSLASIHSYVALTASMLGEWKISKKSTKLAQDALIIAQSSSEMLHVMEDENNYNNDDNNDDNKRNNDSSNIRLPSNSLADGGKRPWKGKEDDENRLLSLQNYRLHQLEEIRLRIESVTTFIHHQTHQAATAAASSSSFISPLQRMIEYIPHFIKTISLSQFKISSDGTILSDYLLESLSKFGFYWYVEKIHKLSDDKNLPIKLSKSTQKSLKFSKNNSKSSSSNPISQEKKTILSIFQPPILFPSNSLADNIIETIKSIYSKVFESNSKLNFRTLFNESNQFINLLQKTIATKSNQKLKEEKEKRDENEEIYESVRLTTPISNSRLVKLEICSGTGEWAVSQAEVDIESDWITIELRHDRVYQTFTRSYQKNLSNICILSGDANEIISSYMIDHSIDHIFINHPEPPQQTGKVLESQAKHLLSSSFFIKLDRILKPDGKITIVTDNLWYGKFLLREFVLSSFPATLSSINLTSPAISAIPLSSSKNVNKKELPFKLVEETKGFHLYSGNPGPECGHMISASSYFDRLWKQDNNSERYFFILTKRITFERQLQRQSSKRFGLFSENSSIKQNKKIKFMESDSE